MALLDPADERSWYVSFEESERRRQAYEWAQRMETIRTLMSDAIKWADSEWLIGERSDFRSGEKALAEWDAMMADFTGDWVRL